MRSFGVIVIAALVGMLAFAPPARSSPPSGQATRVAESVAAAAGAGQWVEALVLLDDSDALAASPAGLARSMERAEYGRYVQERTEQLRALKDEVLSAVGGPDLDRLTDYAVLPVVHVRLRSNAALQRLSRHPRVRSIDENRVNSLALAESLPLIRQPDAQAGGNEGTGVSVCVLDTGADYTHPDFGPCTAPGDPADTCKVIAAVDIAPDDGSLDDDGHGTNVSATVLGVAPGAKVAALDVFEIIPGCGNCAYDSTLIDAIDWCVTHRATYDIAAINMSLGAGRYYASIAPSDSFGTAIANAVDAGITVVAASGNEGYLDSMISPAAYSNVVSVGAVYDSNMGQIAWSSCTDTTTDADKVVCFSNSADFLAMLAPGALITAGGYTKGGTSMASPHAAGAAAVLKAAHPGESVAQIVARLLQGPLVVDHRNSIAKPRLDLIESLAPDAAAVDGDFGGDGKADILARNKNTGQLWLFQMDGATRIASNSAGGLSLDWDVVGVADFGGDGKADILVRNKNTGQLWLFQMDGYQRIASNSAGGLSLDWDVAGVADFGGDGKADILVRNKNTGRLWLFQMDGHQWIASNGAGNLNLDWDVVDVADFGGDGKADILVRNKHTGRLWLFQMDGHQRIASNGAGNLNLDWDVAGVADFGGDGKADILVRNKHTGQLWLFQMDGATRVGSNSAGGLSLDWSIQ